jgi:hypothetical protein
VSGTVVGAIAVGGFWVVLGLAVYLCYRERVARYQAGWMPPPESRPPNPPSGPQADDAQYWGPPPRGGEWGMRSRFERAARLAGVGLGIFFGLLTLGVGPWLVGGLVPLFIGMSRLGMMAANLEPTGPPSRPGPEWFRRGLRQGMVGLALLLGLLLIGVGPWLLAGSVPLGDALGCLGIWSAYERWPGWA